LKVELAKFVVSAGVASSIVIDESGVQRSVKMDGTSDASAGKGSERSGPIRIDNTPVRISTNMTIDRQTPKRDFGDRMKAGLDQAVGVLANGKAAFAAGKFGEAFGQARAAEVKARNIRSAIADFAIKEQGVKSVNPLYDKKAEALKACGPQPGAPGNWVCQDGKWRIPPSPMSKPALEPSRPTPKPVEKIFCTQEAKLCADGSSVGRTGPRCEFAECPAPKRVENMSCLGYVEPVCGADGKTYSNEGCANVEGVKVFTKGECKATQDSGMMIKVESAGSVSR
jgi:hypothetical protein